MKNQIDQFKKYEASYKEFDEYGDMSSERSLQENQSRQNQFNLPKQETRRDVTQILRLRLVDSYSQPNKKEKKCKLLKLFNFSFNKLIFCFMVKLVYLLYGKMRIAFMKEYQKDND